MVAIPLLWQALGFSLVAVVGILGSASWLYLSRMRRPPPAIEPIGRTLKVRLATLLGVAPLVWLTGTYWDISRHLQTGTVPGGSDFLWAPHVVIYGGFLLAFLAAAIALSAIAGRAWKAGVHDPRAWVRAEPHVAGVALASLYVLAAVPGDAIWHALFGIDLTAWSPPHVFLIIAAALQLLSLVALVIDLRRDIPGRRADLALVGLFALLLNELYLLVVEFELPSDRILNPASVAVRPGWSYPLVGGAVAFFVLLAARRAASRLRWPAIMTVVGFYIVRFAIVGAMRVAGGIVPTWPLIFLLGAVLLDLVPERATTQGWMLIAPAAAFAIGFGAVAIPFLLVRADLSFGGQDARVALVAVFVAAALLTPVVEAMMRLLSRPALRRQEPEPVVG